MSHIIWERLGEVGNYVEPFAGSLAVLLGRPDAPKTETCNDLDGFICNAWRAIQYAPLEVAHYCDYPVSESDMHAKHHYLNANRVNLTAKLEGNFEYFDAQLAGFWIWGQCLWIGPGWCSGKGPWQVEDGKLIRRERGESVGMGQKRGLPHLGNAGRGVHRIGMGQSRKLPHLGDAGRGVHHARDGALYEWMEHLSNRLRCVRIACGDWTRVLGPSVTTRQGLTGIFLDPPYGHGERDKDIYSLDHDVAADVLAWCLEHGSNPLLRIALAGYDGEHNALENQGWTRVDWKANGGYANRSGSRGRDNASREALWFSPACIKPDDGLFGMGL